MSKIRLVLPVANKSITFNNPFAKKFMSWQNLLVSVNLLSVVTFFVFIFLIPFSQNLYLTDFDTSVLKFVTLIVLLMLAFFIVKIILDGGKNLVDPKGFFMVLIFNLVLTSASVLIVALKVSNTFGTSGFRYLAGITQLSLIGVFYFVNYHTLKLKSLKTAIDLITLGSIIFVVWNLINLNSGSFVLLNLPLIIFSVALLAYKTIANNESRILYTLLFVVYILLILLSIPFSKVNYLTLFYFTLSLFGAYTVTLLLYASRKRKYLRLRFKEIFTNIKNFIDLRKAKFTPTNKALADLQLIVVFLVPFILIAVSLFFFLNLPSSQQDVVTPIVNHYSDSFRILSNGQSINENNLRSIVLGKGSDNYNNTIPFLANVLLVQGVLGFLIYIVLWVYFINIARASLISNLRNKKDFKLTIVMLLTIIFIPLTLIWGYTDLITIVVLWICYGLINNTVKNIEEPQLTEVSVIRNDNKIRFYGLNLLRVISIIAVWVMFVYLVNYLFVSFK